MLRNRREADRLLDIDTLSSVVEHEAECLDVRVFEVLHELISQYTACTLPALCRPLSAELQVSVCENKISDADRVSRLLLLVSGVDVCLREGIDVRFDECQDLLPNLERM